MDNLGPLVRVLRKERGFTLKSLSEGIVSFSYLSKFEKGQTQISMNNFTQLVQRMNLTVDEVLSFNQTQTNNYTEFFQKIAIAHIQQDLTKLKKHLEIERNLYQEKAVKFHQYNATMISAIIKDLEPDFFIPEEDINELVEYLLTCSFWTTYEVSLFGNSLSLFSEELLLVLLEEIKKRIANYQVIRKNIRDLIRLLQNGALISLRKGKVDQAVKINQYVSTVIERDQYFEMTRQLFIDGVTTLGLGKKNDGLEKAREAIGIMMVFDEQLAKNHQLELDSLQQLYEK